MPNPTERNSEGPKVRVIKRYANRKLYDTHDSRYVTLQQIAEHVRAGDDVSIIDNTTKEDLTNVTLAQIVYEEERRTEGEARKAVSFDTLRHLIQNGGERLFTTLRESPVGKLMPKGREGEAEVAAEAPKEPAKDAKGRILMSPKEAFDELQRLADDRVRSLLGVAINHVQNLQSEVKRLQARIEELEQKLVTAQKQRGSEGREPRSQKTE
jgi:polyhydroxyalkanoate synthesis repressor PhaR